MIRQALMGALEGAKWVLAAYGLFLAVLYNLAAGGKSRKIAIWLALFVVVGALIGSLVARFG